jgi:hypothetical protein
VSNCGIQTRWRWLLMASAMYCCSGPRWSRPSRYVSSGLPGSARIACEHSPSGIWRPGDAAAVVPESPDGREGGARVGFPTPPLQTCACLGIPGQAGLCPTFRLSVAATVLPRRRASCRRNCFVTRLDLEAPPATRTGDRWHGASTRWDEQYVTERSTSAKPHPVTYC